MVYQRSKPPQLDPNSLGAYIKQHLEKLPQNPPTMEQIIGPNLMKGDYNPMRGIQGMTQEWNEALTGSTTGGERVPGIVRALTLASPAGGGGPSGVTGSGLRLVKNTGKEISGASKRGTRILKDFMSINPNKINSINKKLNNHNLVLDTSHVNRGIIILKSTIPGYPAVARIESRTIPKMFYDEEVYKIRDLFGQLSPIIKDSSKINEFQNLDDLIDNLNKSIK